MLRTLRQGLLHSIPHVSHVWSEERGGMRISALVIAEMIALQKLVLLVKCTSQRRALSVGSFFSGRSIPAIADTAGMLLGGRYGVVGCRSAAPLVPFQFIFLLVWKSWLFLSLASCSRSGFPPPPNSVGLSSKQNPDLESHSQGNSVPGLRVLCRKKTKKLNDYVVE